MALPYAKLKGKGAPRCLDPQFWLEDVDFEDPSKIKKANCIRLLVFWSDLLNGEEGVRSFKFESYLEDVDGEVEVMSEEYEEYIARWVEDAPRREAVRAREARLGDEADEGASESSVEAMQEKQRKAKKGVRENISLCCLLTASRQSHCIIVQAEDVEAAKYEEAEAIEEGEGKAKGDSQ